MNPEQPITELIPVITNQEAPTRELFIKEKAQSLLDGNTTIFDIGRDMGLTMNQIRFCHYYGTKEYFANGTEAYLAAYGLDPANTLHRRNAAGGASIDLKNYAVLTLINIILYSEGFNDEFVDKELLFVITQHQDLKAKVAAIKEYNALRSRIKNTVEVKVSHTFDYTALTEKELKTLLKLTEKAKVSDEQ